MSHSIRIRRLLLPGCVLWFAASIAGSCPVASGAAAAPAAKPNVIIFLVDDQGYGDLSCHGNPVIKTPNMDRLHEESVRFTDFHVAPMCTPTRGELMTGVDCLRNGAMNVSSGRTLLRLEFPTMADVFAANGYRCGQFGKWHLGDNYPYRPQDRGFHSALWYPSSHIGSAPDYWNNHYFNDVYEHDGKRQKYTGYTTDVFFDEAIKWMRTQAESHTPFFCYLPTAAAHAPLYVPQKYREPYLTQKPNVASFFGMIANLDENLDKLEQFLKTAGLRDDTILIFMTDNGGTYGVPIYNAGMKGAKQTLWEGGHRVPCFVRWPGGKFMPPADVGELTEVQDILPTMVDLCGLTPPKTARFDGASLGGLLRGETKTLADRMLVVHYSRMKGPAPTKDQAAVLWKRWRLLENKELYDLTTDPGQAHNVIDAHPDVAGRMRAHLDEWWRDIEPRVNEHQAVTIGSDAEQPTRLSPADWEDSFLDQGLQIRAGMHQNGTWNLRVQRDGVYELELRRWAREADAPITAGLPPVKHEDGQLPAGIALPIARARLKIADAERSADVSLVDKSITFRVPLKAGETQLRTWYDDADGKEICGAYYVYVTRIGDAP